MDDNVRKLDFGEESLLESAEKRYNAEDYLGALTMLNKRAEMYDPSADAEALYADIYEALELWPACADAWFRFLDTCNEADFAEGYEGLSIAFMNMGEPFQSELYYRRTMDGELPEIEPTPQLRLVHSSDGPVDGEMLLRGIEFIKRGELDHAREALAEISPESRDYPSASGLIAMCLLLGGDTEGAAKECSKLLEYYPDNIHALTTYCAVLGAQEKTEEARKIGLRLAELDADSPEDLFRVATALCETGLDEQAYEKLRLLKNKLPYGDDVLWFHAVAAYRTGRTEEAISSLERLTTLYPRKEVAKYYLVRMRTRLDGGEEFPIGYFYRLPEEDYKTVLTFFISVRTSPEEQAEELGKLEQVKTYFRIAFDQLDGRDDKLQHLAASAAVKCRCDSAVREILLDYNVGEDIKLSILADLVVRNEENSFGVVVCGIYREFFIHTLEIGRRKHGAFLRAFAEVYSKFALFDEENENRPIGAAEDLYHELEDADALDCAEEKEAVAAVIYREARLPQSSHDFGEMCSLFGADPATVKEILNYII